VYAREEEVMGNKLKVVGLISKSNQEDGNIKCYKELIEIIGRPRAMEMEDKEVQHEGDQVVSRRRLTLS
jgi:hypothetical protein